LIHTSKLPNSCHCSILKTLTPPLPWHTYHKLITLQLIFFKKQKLLHKWRTPLQRDHNNDFNALLVARRSAGPYIVGSFKVPLLKEIVCHLVDTCYSSVLLLSTSSNLMFQSHVSTNTMQANTLHFLVLLVELATTCGFCEHMQKSLWTQCSIMHFWCLLLHTSTHMHKTLDPPSSHQHQKWKMMSWLQMSRLQANMNFNKRSKKAFKKSLSKSK
jgi:hypothetical protein